MATRTKLAMPTSDLGNGLTSFFYRIRALLWAPPRPLATDMEAANPTVHGDETLGGWLLSRVRTFLWVSSGLFSAACLAIPAIGAFAFGTSEGLGTSFLAAILSACFFGVGSVLRFGPDII